MVNLEARKEKGNQKPFPMETMSDAKYVVVKSGLESFGEPAEPKECGVALAVKGQDCVTHLELSLIRAKGVLGTWGGTVAETGTIY